MNAFHEQETRRSESLKHNDRQAITQTARLRDDAAQATRELPMQPTRHCIASQQLVS